MRSLITLIAGFSEEKLKQKKPRNWFYHVQSTVVLLSNIHVYYKNVLLNTVELYISACRTIYLYCFVVIIIKYNNNYVVTRLTCNVVDRYEHQQHHWHQQHGTARFPSWESHHNVFSPSTHTTEVRRRKSTKRKYLWTWEKTNRLRKKSRKNTAIISDCPVTVDPRAEIGGTCLWLSTCGQTNTRTLTTQPSTSHTQIKRNTDERTTPERDATTDGQRLESAIVVRRCVGASADGRLPAIPPARWYVWFSPGTRCLVKRKWGGGQRSLSVRNIFETLTFVFTRFTSKINNDLVIIFTIPDFFGFIRRLPINSYMLWWIIYPSARYKSQQYI